MAFRKLLAVLLSRSITSKSPGFRVSAPVITNVRLCARGHCMREWHRTTKRGAADSQSTLPFHA